MWCTSGNVWAVWVTMCCVSFLLGAVMENCIVCSGTRLGEWNWRSVAARVPLVCCNFQLAVGLVGCGVNELLIIVMTGGRWRGRHGGMVQLGDHTGCSNVDLTMTPCRRLSIYTRVSVLEARFQAARDWYQVRDVWSRDRRILGLQKRNRHLI